MALSAWVAPKVRGLRDESKSCRRGYRLLMRRSRSPCRGPGWRGGRTLAASGPAAHPRRDRSRDPDAGMSAGGHGTGPGEGPERLLVARESRSRSVGETSSSELTDRVARGGLQGPSWCRRDQSITVSDQLPCPAGAGSRAGIVKDRFSAALTCTAHSNLADRPTGNPPDAAPSTSILRRRPFAAAGQISR